MFVVIVRSVEYYVEFIMYGMIVLQGMCDHATTLTFVYSPALLLT